MRTKRVQIAGLFIFVLIGIVGSAFSENADAAKGDKLLKAMSDKLKDAQLFSFTTTEFHDRLKRNGERVEINVERDIVVRRPNGFWTKYSGDRDFEFWYDGKLLTGISTEKKIYVQREMPPSIDEALDLLAQRLSMDLPMSDLLYSSPYDAFMDNQTKGGFVGKETLDKSSCSHLAYTSALVEWQLWIDDDTSMPCQLEMKYKGEKGISHYRIRFSKWDLKPKIEADTFAFRIPDGFVRIPMLERVVVQPDGSQTKPGNNQ